MDRDWHRRAKCKIHLDMHCPEWNEEILQNFDAHEIVRQVASANADALYFFAKDHYGNAYYQTDVGHKHRSLKGRDLLAEIIEQAEKIDLPVMAYFSIIWDNHAAARHPEWCMRDPEGNALADTITSDFGKWRYVCHNSKYVEYTQSMIEEVAAGYGVAGFHLDMLNFDFSGHSCYCENCRQVFRQSTGSELPVEPSSTSIWREFLEFRFRSVEKLFVALETSAHKFDPDFCVVMNYHGSPNFDWRVGQQPVRHSLLGSLGTGETYTPAFGDMYPGLESRFIRNIAPGKPFELVAWRMNRITDFTVKPLEQLRWEVMTCLQHQGSVMLIDQPFHDGRLDTVAYNRISEVFNEAHELDKYCEGEFVPYVAIYYSSLSRDVADPSDQTDFLLPIMGAYKSLVESHVPVDFIFDESVSFDKLQRYPIVLLPNVAAMKDSEVELLREYVRTGGNLVATSESSLYTEEGKPLDDFQLADVFGISYQETIDCDNCYFSNLPQPYGNQIDPRYRVLSQGAIQKVRPLTSIAKGDLFEAFCKREFPTQFFSHNIHPPYRRISDAIFVNRFGSGNCVYVPFGLDRSYADLYELAEHRNLIKNIAYSLNPPPLLEIEAPLNCEATLTQLGNIIRLHLTTYNPIRQAVSLPSLNSPIRPSTRMEEPLLYQATVRCSMPFNGVAAYRQSTKVTIQDEKTFQIICRDVHEMMTIEI